MRAFLKVLANESRNGGRYERFYGVRKKAPGGCLDGGYGRYHPLDPRKDGGSEVGSCQLLQATWRGDMCPW